MIADSHESKALPTPYATASDELLPAFHFHEFLILS
jgi:hypothetical protein